MLHHSISDVRVLARDYLAAKPINALTGKPITKRELSLEITRSAGRTTYSEKLIARLLAGHSCRAESLELASNWFQDNWPDDIPWPQSILRQAVVQLRQKPRGRPVEPCPA